MDMNRLFRLPAAWFGVGYVTMAWTVALLVFVQVYYAGHAVLVNLGNWEFHTQLGHMFSPAIFVMIIFSLVGRLPMRFTLFSLRLFGLYSFYICRPQVRCIYEQCTPSTRWSCFCLPCSPPAVRGGSLMRVQAVGSC